MHQEHVSHPSVRAVPVGAPITFKFVTDPSRYANDFALDSACGPA